MADTVITSLTYYPTEGFIYVQNNGKVRPGDTLTYKGKTVKVKNVSIDGEHLFVSISEPFGMRIYVGEELIVKSSVVLYIKHQGQAVPVKEMYVKYQGQARKVKEIYKKEDGQLKGREL